MKVAIMQPYLFPYIGYFQLIKAVDIFVIHDDVQFIQRGWINRNRILNNNTEFLFSLPVKKASSDTLINQIEWADSFQSDKKKLIIQIENFYKKAPYFESAFQVIKNILENEEQNLSMFIKNALLQINEFLNIKTKVFINSELGTNKNLKGQARVIDIVQFFDGLYYFNPIGGMDLYDSKAFHEKGLDLSFIRTQNIHYNQNKGEFIPFLSIIDVMMFNSKENIEILLETFDIIKQ